MTDVKYTKHEAINQSDLSAADFSLAKNKFTEWCAS